MTGLMISAWLDVRSKPLRTLAAIVGMVAAICAVVIVDAAGNLSRAANRDYIVRHYGRPATLSIGRTDGPDLTPAQVAEAASQLKTALVRNGVSRATGQYERVVNLNLGDLSLTTNAMWTSSAFPDVSFVTIQAGSFPYATAQGDVAHAVITTTLAQQLGFAGPDALGVRVWCAFPDSALDSRMARTWPVVIDGVASSIGQASDGPDIVIASDVPRPELDGAISSHWLIVVNPKDVELVQRLVATVTVGSPPAPVYSVKRVDQGPGFAPLLNQQRVTARAVTWVALIVGGLGILGVGLSSVRERGKDFGLRRALGASKRRIFAGVIVQTLLEALLAAAIAIPLAAIAVELFARRLVLASLPLPASTDLPLDSALRGLVAAITVGLLAGLLPAFRAVRVSVVQALRD